jgi:PadR family transcriptional regulator PadR
MYQVLIYNWSMSWNELRKGSTQTLILTVLAEQPAHGYAIAREIERRSREALQMGEGALYPALRGLEREGFVTSRWEPQPAGAARRVYELTEDGRKHLQAQLDSWRKFTGAVNDVIGGLSIGTTV